MDASIIVALITLAGVLAGLIYQWYDKRVDRNDKKDEAHHKIYEAIAETNRRVDDVAGISVATIRYEILNMERTRRHDGYKTEEDDYLFQDLVKYYHEALAKMGRDNGVINNAVERWNNLPLK